MIVDYKTFNREVDDFNSRHPEIKNNRFDIIMDMTTDGLVRLSIKDRYQGSWPVSEVDSILADLSMIRDIAKDFKYDGCFIR